MSAQHDKTFVVTFGAVLAFLMVFAGVIFVIANMIEEKTLGGGDQEARVAQIDQRTAPVGKVNTDPNAALAAAAAAASSGAASLTTAQVVKESCAACHASGMLGAPKIGDGGAWSARGGIEKLVKTAIAGKGSMPARGGNPGLSDEQIRSAILEMMK